MQEGQDGIVIIIIIWTVRCVAFYIQEYGTIKHRLERDPVYMGKSTP